MAALNPPNLSKQKVYYKTGGYKISQKNASDFAYRIKRPSQYNCINQFFWEANMDLTTNKRPVSPTCKPAQLNMLITYILYDGLLMASGSRAISVMLTMSTANVICSLLCYKEVQPQSVNLSSSKMSIWCHIIVPCVHHSSISYFCIKHCSSNNLKHITKNLYLYRTSGTAKKIDIRSRYRAWNK